MLNLELSKLATLQEALLDLDSESPKPKRKRQQPEERRSHKGLFKKIGKDQVKCNECDFVAANAYLVKIHSEKGYMICICLYI